VTVGTSGVFLSGQHNETRRPPIQRRHRLRINHCTIYHRSPETKTITCPFLKEGRVTFDIPPKLGALPAAIDFDYPAKAGAFSGKVDAGFPKKMRPNL